MGMKLDYRDRAVLKGLFGWHSAPWVDAFAGMMRHLNAQPERVLEIGASGKSAPSMFFLRKGARVEVTCYVEHELSQLREFCERFCDEHRLPLPALRTHDVFSGSANTYDVILLRGVLGGLDRTHNQRVFSKALETCLEMLRPGGQVIVIDKGWCSSLHNRVLRRFGVAGKNNWHYFSQDEIESLTALSDKPVIVWRGFLSVGVMPYPWMQKIADDLDRQIFNRHLQRRGIVFAAAYEKSRAGTSGGLPPKCKKTDGA